MKKILSIILAMLMLCSLVACGATQKEEPKDDAPATTQPEQATEDEFFIGISMPTAQEVCWVAEAKYLEEECVKRGFKCEVAVAEGDAATQYSQIENFIAKGVDAIIVGPYDSGSLGPILQTAHDNGIKIVSTIRLIENCEYDGIICWDQYDMGVQQAKGFLASDIYKNAEKPCNVVILNGDKANYQDCILINQGIYSVLQDEIDAGNVNVVMDEWVEDYLPANARAYVENALALTDENLSAVLCVNDGTAYGSVEALKAVGLETKVYVAGHDAELSAIQYILQDLMHITIWQNEQLIAQAAVDAIEAMLNGEEYANWNTTKDNGKTELNTYMMPFVGITKDNYMETVEAGYYTEEEINNYEH